MLLWEHEQCCDREGALLGAEAPQFPNDTLGIYDARTRNEEEEEAMAQWSKICSDRFQVSTTARGSYDLGYIQPSPIQP